MERIPQYSAPPHIVRANVGKALLVAAGITAVVSLAAGLPAVALIVAGAVAAIAIGLIFITNANKNAYKDLIEDGVEKKYSERFKLEYADRPDQRIELTIGNTTIDLSRATFASVHSEVKKLAPTRADDVMKLFTFDTVMRATESLQQQMATMKDPHRLRPTEVKVSFDGKEVCHRHVFELSDEDNVVKATYACTAKASLKEKKLYSRFEIISR
ncbi:MAG: hypothetical protein MRY21_04575 [Simkaniaceae bacterium]|nr:hypothetical protein [Simkaniaceae bacterium]